MYINTDNIFLRLQQRKNYVSIVKNIVRTRNLIQVDWSMTFVLTQIYISIFQYVSLITNKSKHILLELILTKCLLLKFVLTMYKYCLFIHIARGDVKRQSLIETCSLHQKNSYVLKSLYTSSTPHTKLLTKVHSYSHHGPALTYPVVIYFSNTLCEYK